MARNFDDSSSARVQTSLGALGFAFGPGTICAIIRRDNDTTADTIVHVGGGTGSTRYALGLSSTHQISLRCGASTVADSGITVTASDGWCFIAAGKDAGTSAFRAHKYRYSDGSWSDASGATLADSTAPGLGAFIASNGTVFFGGDIECVAVVDRHLSDTEMRALPFSWAAWIGLNARGLWRLNQASIQTAINDWTGGGAQETLVGDGTSTVSADGVPLLGYSAPVLLTAGSDNITETPVRGEANAGGNQPGAAIAVAAGGAIAGGVAPADSAQQVVTPGGATAAGNQPAARTVVPAGSAAADGRAPGASVDLAAGGAEAGGVTLAPVVVGDRNLPSRVTVAEHQTRVAVAHTSRVVVADMLSRVTVAEHQTRVAVTNG